MDISTKTVTAVLMIGLPSSGKLVRAEELATEMGGARIVQYAQFRYPKAPPSPNPVAHLRPAPTENAWKRARREMRECLAQGKNLIVVAQNTDPEFRKDLIGFLRQKGAKRVVGYYRSITPKLASQRSAAAGEAQKVSELVAMQRALREVPPTVGEDEFDELFVETVGA